MGKIVSFFAGGPARIQAMLIAAAAVAIACMGLLVWGLYWRGEYREAKAALAVYVAQVEVSSAALAKCNAGAEETRAVAAAAIAAMGGLVDEARRNSARAKALAERLDALARQERKPGEGCDWAWDQIEQQHRKAGATP